MPVTPFVHFTLPIPVRAAASRTLVTLVALVAAFPAATALAPAQVFVKLDPRHTYLRRNNDPAPEPTPLVLSALGIAPGDVIRIRRLGDFDNGPGAEAYGSTIAVFSNGPALLAATLQARVPGALEAGCNWTSSATWFGSLPTDIPEDFAVAVGANASATQNEVRVVVPAGTTHLFVGAHDSLYYDNTDPDGDYGVELTVLAPTQWSLLGGGVGGALGIPSVAPSGQLVCGSSIAFAIGQAPANAAVVTAIGASRINVPLFGGVLVPAPQAVIVLGSTDATGNAILLIPVPVTIASATPLFFQHVLLDPTAPQGVAMTSGISGIAP